MAVVNTSASNLFPMGAICGARLPCSMEGNDGNRADVSTTTGSKAGRRVRPRCSPWCLTSWKSRQADSAALRPRRLGQTDFIGSRLTWVGYHTAPFVRHNPPGQAAFAGHHSSSSRVRRAALFLNVATFSLCASISLHLLVIVRCFSVSSSLNCPLSLVLPSLPSQFSV